MGLLGAFYAVTWPHSSTPPIQGLKDRLKAGSESYDSPNKGVIEVLEHFQFAIFYLLAFMCYGENLDEKSISQREKATRKMIQSGSRFQVLDQWPVLGKTVYYHQRNEFLELRKNLEMAILPHIRARKQATDNQNIFKEAKWDIKDYGLPIYVDTLLELKPEEGRQKRAVTEDEIINLCNELIVAGSDTTSTILQ
ncbi:Cytochrome P450 89A9-like protein [Drosera capensis]